MLNRLISQYLDVQKQLNLSILLPQFLLNYQQNSQYDIVGQINRYLNHDEAQKVFDDLVMEKVFIPKSVFIDKLTLWYETYFNKTQIEQRRLDIVKALPQEIVTHNDPVTMTSDLLLLQFAQLEYDKSQMTTQEQCSLAQGLYQYYEQCDVAPHIQMINGDDHISGLELSCYILNNMCAIFAFRGSQTKFFQTMSPHDFEQSRLDWQYNLKAIVQGTETSQYYQAIHFIEAIQQQYPQLQHYYATGHSLGGHLVQLIQMTKHYFKDYVVCNSSPLQLKQVFLLQPDLFTSLQWQQLFEQQDKAALLPQATGRIYQYQSDLINIAREIPQTFYYGQLITLPEQPYFHYKPYLQQCFTSTQLTQLTDIVYEALNIEAQESYDFVVDLLQTMMFKLLSHDKWQGDYVQIFVNLLNYLKLNQWVTEGAYDKCLVLLKQYQQSFESTHQLNYLKRTTLTMQLQYQLYKGLNTTRLTAIASMHRISGHWFALEEREINEHRH